MTGVATFSALQKGAPTYYSQINHKPICVIVIIIMLVPLAKTFKSIYL